MSAGLYESQEEAVQREEVLGCLDQVREKSLSSTSDDELEAGGNCVELYQKFQLNQLCMIFFTSRLQLLSCAGSEHVGLGLSTVKKAGYH